ncbi:hypothetical protein SH580_02180 [Coraliomargarita algicola]|uniref:Uncharacterized protein n=1 Tax=Coraliomargarita algicola TaxID=3092156 RepID=A0ABZ0RJY5_9BACT|nr:hypothetical protein [Coraliomargarita sp. J2-16]WPJ96510.1 hypothetical protein SH580_02180 [Coraliomargarita sp. J2-16]
MITCSNQCGFMTTMTPHLYPNINMKQLLIPFLLLTAAMTAHAHCGSCGTGAAHPAKSESKAFACDIPKKADCDKQAAACAEKKDCDEKTACGDKKDCSEKAACDTKKDCGTPAACADKKDCADMKDCAEKSECAEKKASKPAALPMPKMACCAGK